MNKLIIKLLCCALAALILITAVSCNQEAEEDAAEKTARDFIENMYTLLNDGKYTEYAELFDKSDDEKQAMAQNYTASEEFFNTVYSIDTLTAKQVDDVLLVELVYMQETKLLATGGSNVIKSEVSYALKQYDGVWKVSTYTSGESVLISENDGSAADVTTAEAN